MRFFCKKRKEEKAPAIAGEIRSAKSQRTNYCARPEGDWRRVPAQKGCPWLLKRLPGQEKGGDLHLERKKQAAQEPVGGDSSSQKRGNKSITDNRRLPEKKGSSRAKNAPAFINSYRRTP